MTTPNRSWNRSGSGKRSNSVHLECKQDLIFARRNIMTVDLEDYYCHLPIFLWGKYESRVVMTTRTILDLFDIYKANATFFTIGYIAEKHPELIEEIVSRGHEIASHGYSHHSVKNMNVKEFEYDLKKSLEVLETISGEKVLGFRAPYCSINKQNLWAFHVMRKNRIRYDCSLCPVRFHYGLPDDAPRHIYRMRSEERRVGKE